MELQDFMEYTIRQSDKSITAHPEHKRLSHGCSNVHKCLQTSNTALVSSVNIFLMFMKTVLSENLNVCVWLDPQDKVLFASLRVD